MRNNAKVPQEISTASTVGSRSGDAVIGFGIEVVAGVADDVSVVSVVAVVAEVVALLGGGVGEGGAGGAAVGSIQATAAMIIKTRSAQMMIGHHFLTPLYIAGIMLWILTLNLFW